jgi:hypothetical protein
MGAHHAGLPIFTLNLDQMPQGSYTWFFVVTEPGTYHIIAQAQAPSTLEPWGRAVDEQGASGAVMHREHGKSSNLSTV